MRAFKLAEIEAKFKSTLNASGRQFKGMPGEFPGVVRLHSVDTKDFFYKDVIRKEKIWVHGTAGILTGDLWTLSQSNNHVSVAYTIARDGTIYQLFDDRGWAYHLGGLSSAPNKHWSQHSVAIELSNLGPLVESKSDPNILVDAYGKDYCTKFDTQFYGAVNYRGYKFFASYTDAQYAALNGLIKNLCEKHKIKFSKIAAEKAYDWFPGTPQETVISHVNVRKDKFDLPPVFDWSRITGQ